MTEREWKKIRTELKHDGRILHLFLNAPKANILDTIMIGEIREAIEAHATSASLAAIVFEGSGNHFSFGASVEEHTKDKVAAMLPEFHALFRTLFHASVPTIAVVRGQCLGGGMELAAFATWIFASKTASFGQPEINLAVFPPVASILLPWRIGGGAALDFCVSGRSMNAEDAKRVGLVTETHDDPWEACKAFVSEHILGKSPSSLRFAERAARAALRAQFDAHLLAMERLYLDELMATHDANEGIAAFLERRRPSFDARHAATP